LLQELIVIEPFASFPPKLRSIALAASIALPGETLLIVPAQAVANVHRPSDSQTYVLFSEGSGSTTMSGSMEDMHRARALRAGREALLYARHEGIAYVVRDAATLRRAQAIFEPQQAMGARQAELGARQAALGRRQAALGAEQARIGRQQAAASPQRAAALGHQQAELGRQQDTLGRQQDALGREQSALGREQERLGREAHAQLRRLLAEAIRTGVARRAD
jgi:hypothetical protein